MPEFLVHFSCGGHHMFRFKYAATASIAFAKVCLDMAESDDVVINCLSVTNVTGKDSASIRHMLEHDLTTIGT